LVNARTIVNRFLKGARRTAIIAVTSRCNCRCQMCNIYDSKPVDLSYSDAVKILDFMAANKFLITYFTGGEPSLHPDLPKIVEHADKLGLVTSLTTNGTVSKSMLRELKDAGLYAVSISIDSWDSAVSEEIRRHRAIGQKQKETFQTAHELGLRTYSMTHLGTHLNPENIEKMVAYVNHSLGASFGFCYPAATAENTYRLGQSVQLHSEETIRQIIERLVELKKKGYKIVNMVSYMEDALRFLNGESVKFPCRAGEYVFYVDWHGDVYPCFAKKKLFNILNETQPHFPEKISCNECMIDCFREPSLLAYVSSPRLIVKEIMHSNAIKETLL